MPNHGIFVFRSKGPVVSTFDKSVLLSLCFQVFYDLFVDQVVLLI